MSKVRVTNCPHIVKLFSTGLYSIYSLPRIAFVIEECVSGTLASCSTMRQVGNGSWRKDSTGGSHSSPEARTMLLKQFRFDLFQSVQVDK